MTTTVANSEKHPHLIDPDRDECDFEKLCQNLRRVVDFDVAVVLERDEKRDILQGRQVYPPDPRSEERMVVGVDGVVQEMVEGSLSGAVCVDTTRSCCNLERQMARLGLRSTLCMPVQLGPAEGVMCLGSHKPGAFGQAASSAMNELQTC